MKIEWKPTQGEDSVGQFIVYAEGIFEREILRRFIQRSSKNQYKFWMNGSCYSCDLKQYTSFNFGFIEEEKKYGSS